MDDLYGLLLRYLPRDIPRDVVIQRFDLAHPTMRGAIGILAVSGMFLSQSLLGLSITDALIGIISIIVACTIWIQKPLTRINPEYKWSERGQVILFLILGFYWLLLLII